MSSGTYLWSEDQFLCSICLDVFVNPVTTPCGHNFCRTCITKIWDRSSLYKCPLCNEHFTSKPQLRTNTLFSEVVDQFRREAQEQAVQPGEVPCDICTGPKLKALKSCQVCLLSFCHTHLEPHLTAPRLKNHQLMEPVKNLEDRMCMKHDRPLELFCRTDQMCVCSLCPVLGHNNHELVPLREESEGTKAELRKTEVKVQQMIQNRRLKVQEIRESVKISKVVADREKAGGVRVFTALKESAERGLKELIKEIEDKQKATEKQAEDFIGDLEREIFVLMKRSSEVKLLSQVEDHLHVVQSFSSLKVTPPTKTWMDVRVCPPPIDKIVARAVAQLEEEMKKIIKEAELKRVRQFAVDVTLDPDTAHPKLVLSDDRKRVEVADVWRSLPDNPERFSKCVSVFGRQSFSSGRFYSEVQVKGKTKWSLGVARESINRKRITPLSPQNGFWTIMLRNVDEYTACADSPVRLHLQPGPEKVGVFVDYEGGLVSFYDAGAGDRIYSFTCCSFAQKLYLFFDPCNKDGGRNSAPMIICPVNQAGR
ncbi:E3 ubiquitin-protein ligase TRIM39-like isoform X2 [Poecilia reticulata]|uniref:E3 ubiquitin-protein ligase TRIM39-like n=2 Tax=Poecilia reticulata TaxID=8081 RepID=A0A3P9NA68_POERE|nr:PREDICTED: E3 ubiquitin-protein ligase TRIM39-like isoform X2 [Poecilia reticulata]